MTPSHKRKIGAAVRKARRRAEAERLKYHYHALEAAYKRAIEECARVAEQNWSGVDAARAIRALKDKP